jgi:hypothetical protein
MAAEANQDIPPEQDLARRCFWIDPTGEWICKCSHRDGVRGGFSPRSISLPETETLPPFGDRQSHTCPPEGRRDGVAGGARDKRFFRVT